MRRLLRSPLRSTAVFGYLSVIYWGNYASQAGVSNRRFALARVKFALPYLNTPCNELAVARTLRAAYTLINRRKYGDALWLLTTLPRLGIAFASKACALMAPDHCGVIDSVIAEQYPQFGFTLRQGYIAKTHANAVRFQRYCYSLQ